MSKIKLSKEFIKSTVKLALNEDLDPVGHDEESETDEEHHAPKEAQNRNIEDSARDE